MTPSSEQILLEALPHRPPFRFITSVLAIEHGQSGEAVWELDGTEDFFAGHFPGRPVVPGVLITEALAQLSGIVAFFDPQRRQVPSAHLAHVDVRIRSAVTPPASIHLESTAEREMASLHQFRVAASFEGRIVAKGSITLARIDAPVADVRTP